MRFNRKFIVFATCVIITTVLFDSISNAAQLLKLERSWSSQDAKELVIGLKATNIREKENKIQADVILWNNTMTWVYVEQDFTQRKIGQVPVSTQGVYLLGPLYTKNLGTIEFSKDSFLQFNAKTAIGTSPGTRESNMLLGALAIDLAMRGFFSKELPPNAFDRPLVFPIELGMALIDPLFFTITSHCSGPLGALSRAMVMKDIDGALNALGRFLLCTTEASIREKMQEWLIKLFSKEMAEKWAKRFVGSIGDFLNLPMKATLLKILTEYTLDAPPESWARIDAVETEEPVIKEWKEYKLGALSFSVPLDWKVIERENSFAAGPTEDYMDRRYVTFMVGVMDAFEDVEQGKVRIVHYGTSGGKMIEELGTSSQTISIAHMGHLVDSFKTEVAGLPVTVCVLHLTEKEGMPVKGIEFTNWSFALIEGGKHYAFTFIGTDPAYQSAIFKQLISRIAFY